VHVEIAPDDAGGDTFLQSAGDGVHEQPRALAPQVGHVRVDLGDLFPDGLEGSSGRVQTDEGRDHVTQPGASAGGVPSVVHLENVDNRRPNERPHDVGAVAEVLIKGAERDAGPLGDLADSGLEVAPGREELGRARQQAGPRLQSPGAGRQLAVPLAANNLAVGGVDRIGCPYLLAVARIAGDH
jgi:hypothetical protein